MFKLDTKGLYQLFRSILILPMDEILYYSFKYDCNTKVQHQ